MNNRKSTLQRYYRTIRSYLPCPGKMKKQILNDIRANITSYLQEFPDADFPQIEARFGTPQTIAASYVDDMNTEELLQSLYIRQKVFKLILACFLAALIMWGTVLTTATIRSENRSESYIEIIINEN